MKKSEAKLPQIVGTGGEANDKPSEGLTEEQERLLAVIGGVVTSCSCKVCDKCSKAMATEIYLKAVILGFKSPQEVKEQVGKERERIIKLIREGSTVYNPYGDRLLKSTTWNNILGIDFEGRPKRKARDG